MNTLDVSSDRETDSTEELTWGRLRRMELGQKGCPAALEDDRCSCEHPQSATEFFLTGPSDIGCECESC
jgi:hypothetical protein